MRRFLFLLVLAFTISGLSIAQRADLSGIKICIDPGHGGYNSNDRHVIPDPGIDFWESESNFEKAKLLKSLLEAKGAWVILTRNSNSGTTYLNPDDADEPSLSARWQLANDNNVNWFHSIHSNAAYSTPGLNTSINYTLLLVKEVISTRKPAWPQAVSMSDIIGPSIQHYMRTSSRTTFTYLDYTFYGGTNGGYNLGVLSGLAMPGELSEGEFHDYYPETRRLLNNSYRKMEAYAIRDAFLSYFGVPADPLCIIAGILTNSGGSPINGVQVRLLPENIVYSGDNFNNGFYMFDSLRAGVHTLSFETPNYNTLTQQLTANSGTPTFFDAKFQGGTAVSVNYTSPSARDTIYPVNQLIAIGFTLPMDTASVRQAFSISPSVPGTFSWYNSLTLLWFKPAQPLQYSTWYTYRIDGSARTTAGGLLDGNRDGIGGDALTVTFRTQSGATSVENALEIRDFALFQNYPNPFNPMTNIEFRISNFEFVSLKVFDLLSREVATLVSRELPPGSYQATFDASRLSSGVYLYQLKAGLSVQTRRMVLTK